MSAAERSLERLRDEMRAEAAQRVWWRDCLLALTGEDRAWLAQYGFDTAERLAQAEFDVMCGPDPMLVGLR